MKLLGIVSDHRAFKSKSPAMHARVLKSLGLAGAYLPLAVEPSRLGQAVQGLAALGFAGANVTVPHKEAVLAHLDRLSPEVESIGAVNTIVIEDGRATGHNTDAAGFTAALAEAGLDPAARRVVVIGAGGAARAVLFSLTLLGPAQIVLAGRSPERTSALAARFKAKAAALDDLAREIDRADLVVNATSVSAPGESADLARLVGRWSPAGCRLVMDLNYGREKNLWRDLAGRIGASFRDGLPMLAHQAQKSFQLWTGLKVDVAEFQAGLEGGE